MSSYRYTDHGAGYPMSASYHDNTGYYGNGQDMSRKESQRFENPPSFEPVRTYPSQMVVSRGERFSWHMLRTAVASIFCCPFCGLFGLVYAILSYVDFRKGDSKGYLSKRNCALGWSVTSIVLGVLWYLAIATGLILSLTGIWILFRY